MRPFPALVALFLAGLVASVAAVERWPTDLLVIALMACLASALVAFNWWELWASRHER
jgi:hypothetical protein